MRFATISDIHGNHLALEAVLHDIARLDIVEILNLGDHFGGPLEAGKTADLLVQQENMLSINGNHDRIMLDFPRDELGTWDGPARDQLEPRHVDWLADRPPTAVFKGEVFLCHGIPTSDSEHWMDAPNPTSGMSLRPLKDIEQEAADLDFSMMLCGHSHVQRMVRLSDGRRVVNPGSVGCHGFRDDRSGRYVSHVGNPAAAYAILEKLGGEWDISFRQIPYDHMAMAEIARSKGHLDWASALSSGWIK
ncbi:MAG: metallophosphoesterase family protein [Hyphomicrobiales bacterium]